MNKKIFTAPYIVWIAGFILIPLLFIVFYGFTDMGGAITFSNISSIAEPTYLNSLLVSLKLSVISTAVCLLLAYPLAYILSKYSNGKKGFTVFVFILPMWMNSLLRLLALKTLFEENGVLNIALEAIGLNPVSILGTESAVVIGTVYDYLPFMLLPIYNSLVKIDKGVIEAAKDLGANSFTVLRKVVIPLSVPGIISGITMVFVPAVSEFTIASIMGNNKIMLIGNIIERKFINTGEWNIGSGLSIVLMAFVIISMSVFEKFDKDGGESLI